MADDTVNAENEHESKSRSKSSSVLISMVHQPKEEEPNSAKKGTEKGRIFVPAYAKRSVFSAHLSAVQYKSTHKGSPTYLLSIRDGTEEVPSADLFYFLFFFHFFLFSAPLLSKCLFFSF